MGRGTAALEVLYSGSPREQVLTMKAVSSNRGTPLAGGPNQRGRWGGFHVLGGAVVKKNDEIDIWAQVFVTDGCWHWLGVLKNGYGVVNWNSRMWRAHRLVYELRIGAIPAGLQLDHLCRNRSCVNPAHLEPVTNRENVLRGDGVTARNSKKTHCKHGHALAGNNVEARHGGGRECRECHLQRNRVCASLEAPPVTRALAIIVAALACGGGA